MSGAATTATAEDIATIEKAYLFSPAGGLLGDLARLDDIADRGPGDLLDDIALAHFSSRIAVRVHLRDQQPFRVRVDIVAPAQGIGQRRNRQAEEAWLALGLIRRAALRRPGRGDLFFETRNLDGQCHRFAAAQNIDSRSRTDRRLCNDARKPAIVGYRLAVEGQDHIAALS